MSQKTKQIKDDVRERSNRPNKLLHTCSYCGYTSSRLFNVVRHEDRIHSKKIEKVCCGQKLLSKDAYYIHCEKHHPETRANAITSRYKYKISKYSAAFNEQAKEICKPKLKRRISERILAKKERKMHSQVSLSYKVTYSDTENIPLKYFLTDCRLRRHMKSLSTLSKINKADETIPEQKNEETASENVTQELRDSFDLPANNLIDLPTKKLILHRFRKSATRKFGIPLRVQNNNDPGHANSAEATATKSVSLMQNYDCRSKNSKWGANKENLPTFAFSYEQKIDIVLDSCITAPVVTQLQRDFLDSFDFDQYRIF